MCIYIKFKGVFHFFFTLVFLISVLLVAFYVDRDNVQVEQPVATSSPANVPDAHIQEGTVISVIDGDTLKVKINNQIETVRLLLIDTPETHHPTKPVQEFGKEAEDYARSVLIPDSIVGIEVGNPERDHYGRLLAYLWIGQQTFNEMQVENGYARVAYVYPPNDKYIDPFIEAEDQAKSKKLGIWSLDGYVHTDGFYYDKKK